jgi:fatty-acyl-CoA synthase
MSPTTTLLRSEDAVRKMGSVGTPLPSIEVRIVDEEMRDVPVGEVGEVVYRGPTMMLGYWNKPEETAAAFAGGWFHSGDLCRMDDEGYIYVVDRKKDMIISGGENIYCAEVEGAIDSHPKVAEVAVVGIPHPKWVQTPCAVIVPADPADPPGEQEIIEHCRTRLASYKKPTSVVIIDALPRNASGKVQKFRLREQLAGTGAT